ncbi:hypothetical protein TNCV_2913941 [Trichonephila clavipes]|nr:hypothetical protein TNCV_2913941 [Trichonephila clavipes]
MSQKEIALLLVAVKYCPECCLAVDMETIKGIGSILIVGDIYECYDTSCYIRNFDLRAIGRLEASQSRVEVSRWLQVAQKWFLSYGIDSKQVVLSPKKDSQGHPRALTSAQDRYLSLSTRQHRRTAAH